MSANSKIGKPPGELCYIGKNRFSTTISYFHYDENCFSEEVKSGSEIALAANGVNWIKVDGLGDIDQISAIGRRFNIHALVIEDILNTNHPPKYDDSGNSVFITFKRITVGPGGAPIFRQVSLLLVGNTVISFHENNDGMLDPFIERIRQGLGKIRGMGADYLIYAILDFIIDHYFLVLESVGERLEKIEQELMSAPSEKLIHQIHVLKRELLVTRKSVWPLRKLVSEISHGSNSIFTHSCEPYLRDLYDHILQIIDMLDGHREITSSLLDLYMSSISNRMNMIMQTLTIISTIFIPLTFMAGIYGMNFEVMPELKWPWGYPALLGVMSIVTVFMLRFFKRKRWL